MSVERRSNLNDRLWQIDGVHQPDWLHRAEVHDDNRGGDGDCGGGGDGGRAAVDDDTLTTSATTTITTTFSPLPLSLPPHNKLSGTTLTDSGK